VSLNGADWPTGNTTSIGNYSVHTEVRRVYRPHRAILSPAAGSYVIGQLLANLALYVALGPAEEALEAPLPELLI